VLRYRKAFSLAEFDVACGWRVADGILAMNTAHSSNYIESSQATFAGAVAYSDLATDETLVATAQMGDERAFETLVKRHRPRIFAIALRYTRVREDAEDVVQQTFQKTFVHLNNFEGKSSFSTWLTRIAINEALMYLRRARLVREVSIDDLNGDEGTGPRFNIADASPDPEATYMQREEARILWIAIRQLTPRIRSVLELKELRELSARETARHMGLSVAAVKARVFHGRQKLRKHIADVGSSRKPERAFQRS
jgi:RNA polymerase sigma-70 factor (ECF subfamily)